MTQPIEATPPPLPHAPEPACACRGGQTSTPPFPDVPPGPVARAAKHAANTLHYLNAAAHQVTVLLDQNRWVRSALTAGLVLVVMVTSDTAVDQLVTALAGETAPLGTIQAAQSPGARTVLVLMLFKSLSWGYRLVRRRRGDQTSS